MTPTDLPTQTEWSIVLTLWAGLAIVLGEIVAFCFMWYLIKDRMDLWRRMIGSAIVGAIGGLPMLENWLKWPIKQSNVIVVFAVMTFLAWPILWALVRLVEKWMPPSAKK
jgi:hypothetical protein